MTTRSRSIRSQGHFSEKKEKKEKKKKPKDLSLWKYSAMRRL
jgi:cysteinyl-tRNA synthetase